MGRSVQALTTESLVAGLFLAVAVVGFKKNLWLVVAALAGHGVFDFFHHLFMKIRVSRCGGPASAGIRCSRQRGLSRAADEALRIRTHSDIDELDRSRA